MRFLKSENMLILFFILIYCVVIVAFNFLEVFDNFFPALANSFLQGKLFFLRTPENIHDTVLFNGRYYWPLGPFPAVFLMVWVRGSQLFHYSPYMAIPQILLVLGTLATWIGIGKKLGYSFTSRLYLAYAFCASTVFFGVALIPASWYFAQVLTAFLVSLAILEYCGKKRWIIIGVLMGCALATRLAAGLALVFFIYTIFRTQQSKIDNLARLLFPIIIAGLLLALYNFARFGNPMEHGYNWQILGIRYSSNRDAGLHSLAHLPGNLYYFLLSGPLPVFKDGVSHILKFPFIEGNKWGMSIFVTSPYLIYLWFTKLKDWRSIPILVTAFIVALPILTYYGIGFSQFGFRYSLDFLPWLHLVLMLNLKDKKNLGFKMKILIFLGSVFNFYLMMTQYFSREYF